MGKTGRCTNQTEGEEVKNLELNIFSLKACDNYKWRCQADTRVDKFSVPRRRLNDM